MNKTFIKGALYCGLTHNPEFILKYLRALPTKNPRFEPVQAPMFGAYVTGKYAGTVGFGMYTEPDEFRRAFHWSDLPTAKDRENAALKCDPLNGKFEEDFLRHYAAKRARLRHLTPVLGGEYYAKP